jgi:hypothetical protein
METYDVTVDAMHWKVSPVNGIDSELDFANVNLMLRAIDNCRRDKVVHCPRIHESFEKALMIHGAILTDFSSWGEVRKCTFFFFKMISSVE